MKYFVLISLFLLQVAVAEAPQSRPNIGINNPYKAETSKYYSAVCHEHNLNRNYLFALKSCHQAITAPDWSKQTAETKSRILYQYAQLLRKNKKYKQAVEKYQEAINNEKKTIKPDPVKLGRRYAEMAGGFYELKEYKKGSENLDKVLADTSRYTHAEKDYLAMLCYIYSTKLKDKKKAKSYLLKIEEMGFIADEFKSYLY